MDSMQGNSRCGKAIHVDSGKGKFGIIQLRYSFEYTLDLRFWKKSGNVVMAPEPVTFQT